MGEQSYGRWAIAVIDSLITVVFAGDRVDLARLVVRPTSVGLDHALLVPCVPQQPTPIRVRVRSD